MTGFSLANITEGESHFGDKPSCAGIYGRRHERRESRSESDGIPLNIPIESFAERRHGSEGDARIVATLLLPVDIGCLYAGDHACEARSASSCTFARVLSGVDRHIRFRLAAELRIGDALGAEDTKRVQKCVFLHPRWFDRSRCNSCGMNGGDDETRTRDLCRDRIHSSDSTESVGYVGNSRQPSGLLGMIGRILCNGLCNASAAFEAPCKVQLRPRECHIVPMRFRNTPL